MNEQPIFVVVEVTAVKDMAGLQRYTRSAGALIGSFGGAVVAQGEQPIDGEASFAPLAIQRWSSEAAFRIWLASDAYRPLDALRRDSATMRVAIVPVNADEEPGDARR